MSWYGVSSTPKHYTLTGLVGVAGTELWGGNLLAGGPCSDTPFIIPDPDGPSISVSNSSMGNANWDCHGPFFYFGPEIGTQLDTSQRTQSFTFTPPAGYTCDSYWLLGPRLNESFTHSGNSCTLTLTLGASGNLFVWFFVQPTLSYSVAGTVGILDSSDSISNNLTQGSCPGYPWVTAADMGAATSSTHEQLLDAHWAGGPLSCVPSSSC